ncbi:protein phosphatase [Rhodobacter aestuarii]|uniref:Protein phosphatase n=1 Tax=Rhodobacter aestuarii TaxID=453582 RepID=A0A1N7JWN1_9RHOB|nr:protein phosphatase 2C domain-containing protein [Rhodobacter aestuarii]PTV95957.1 protein phosphatase [Rhodobacter aestuarii]SIS53748.1 protein phosphatase [Rhodobacter aestuarii]
MSETDLFLFDTGQRTDVGRVRDHNEDAYLARPDAGLWVVADGMGGHAAGDFASLAITGELGQIGVPGSLDDLQARVFERLGRATMAIRSRSQALGGATVGATLVALLLYEDEFACLWAGDSRVYLMRGGTLFRLTEDHTEVQALLNAGAITEAEARTWPRRNVITRAIGVTDLPECERSSGRVEAGDLFILCSDGLTGHIEDNEIEQMAKAPRSAQALCDELVALTLERGAHDNVTAVAVRCHPAPVLD